MKPSPMLVLVAASLALGLTACGKKETSSAASTTATASHADHATAEAPAAKTVEKPATATATATESVLVEANDQMKFSVTRIEATAGSPLSITLKNVGKLPKAAMGHNLVLLKKSADAMKFASAAMGAAQTDYIPAAMVGDVIAHTKMLGPNESDTITFTVPAEPGEYVFLCSFPAHYMAGMKGLLVVTAP